MMDIERFADSLSLRGNFWNELLDDWKILICVDDLLRLKKFLKYK